MWNESVYFSCLYLQIRCWEPSRVMSDPHSEFNLQFCWSVWCWKQQITQWHIEYFVSITDQPHIQTHTPLFATSLRVLQKCWQGDGWPEFWSHLLGIDTELSAWKQTGLPLMLPSGFKTGWVQSDSHLYGESRWMRGSSKGRNSWG